jgi:hypothetical protein
MSAGDIHDRYHYEKKLGRDGPFVCQLVRLRTDGQATPLLLRRLAPEVRCEQSALHAFIETSENLSAVDALNLLKTIECGVDREGLYLVTEYPRHVTLMSLLGRIMFPPLQAAMVVEQAARGLTAAGDGMIHGTLAPRHLWITSTGVIKIKDFGLYILFRDLGPWFKEEKSSYWFDPEVLAGHTPDESADCYSLGRILQELLRVGTIQQGTAERSAAVVCREDLPQHVPDRLCSILATCLHADRTQRFGTSMDLVSALHTFLNQGGISDAVDGLKSFLQQQAKGSGSLDRFEQPATIVQQPDHQAALLNPASFWTTEHDEYVAAGNDAAPQELPKAQTRGLLKSSHEGNIPPRRPALSVPVAGTHTSSEAVSIPRKKVDLSDVPVWLQAVGGVLLATFIGGLLGWFLIGRWTLEESDGKNLYLEKTQNADTVKEHAPKEDTAVQDSGGVRDVEPPAKKELSNTSDEIQQEPASDKGTEPHDKCIAGCGWIYITSVPSGATVELDGNEVPGKTPLLINKVSANDSHVLRVLLSGRTPHKQNVTVNSGDVLNVAIELK